MTRYPALILLLALLFLTAPAAASDSEVKIVVSEVTIQADDAVKAIGYTVNGEPNVEQIFVTSGREVSIVMNPIPDGETLHAVVRVNGEYSRESSSSPILLRGFSATEVEHVVVSLTLTSGLPSSSPSGGSMGTIPTYTPVVPTETPTPSVEPTDDATEGEKNGGWCIYLLSCVLLVLGIFFILFLVLRRKIYRILRDAAKRHGFETERAHLKKIAKAIILLLRDKEQYASWRLDSAVEALLGLAIVQVLDDMEYPAVPREEVLGEILEAGRGVLSRYLL